MEHVLDAMENDLLLFVEGPSKVVNQSLANLRLHLGERLSLIPKGNGPCGMPGGRTATEPAG